MNTYKLTMKELDINPDVIKAYKDFYNSMVDETNITALETGIPHYLCFTGDRYVISDVPMADVEYQSLT